MSKLYQIDISELINDETILQSQNVITSVAGIQTFAAAPPRIIDNIDHFLKLFNGKNIALDFTDISKEDLMVLAQYKRLDKRDQKEVCQFIKFKSSISKQK